MTQKIFKIERDQHGGDYGAAADSYALSQQNMMMSALEEIKQMLAERPAGGGAPDDVLESFRDDMKEAARIKAELNLVQKAIDRTKQEIAALRLPGGETSDLNRMTEELSAIVSGTEKATENILSSAEHIDENISDMIPGLRSKNHKELASDIQEHVVQIFEACNFQDLTGQRINKVVRAFGFIEQRVDQMMDIWGGIESFKGFEPVPEERAEGCGKHLLNGPAIGDEEGIASQDDIDALFD